MNNKEYNFSYKGKQYSIKNPGRFILIVLLICFAIRIIGGQKQKNI